MKLTVTPLERPSLAKTRFTLSYMRTDGCFVPTRPNTGAVFGRTNNTFGGTLSYVLPLFSTLEWYVELFLNMLCWQYFDF